MVYQCRSASRSGLLHNKELSFSPLLDCDGSGFLGSSLDDGGGVAITDEANALFGARDQADDWLDSTLRQLIHEARYTRPGSQIMVTRLTDVIFVQAVRAWLSVQPKEEGGWLGALRDRQIGQALGLMH